MLGLLRALTVPYPCPNKKGGWRMAKFRVWFTQPVGNDRTKTIEADKFVSGVADFVVFEKNQNPVFAVKRELVATIERLPDTQGQELTNTGPA